MPWSLSSKTAQFEQTEWTVSDLTAYIREMFDLDFRLREVTVSGEISNFTQARSGHLYFTLKDAGSQLKCVMWRSAAERLYFRPEDGDAVVATGRVSVYDAGGVYQLYADHLQPVGRGDLALAFERLKQRLAEEGLFDPAHKKSIPAFPRTIGIVTSADAAALRDILNVLARRYPLASVLIAPTLVQGADAPPQIIRALRWLDGRSDIDTIIIARGGGSIEDLWAFNDERVARAIFAAQHPVISGVGHETDFTIADFVADLRAPTPSAAAELATPDMAEVHASLRASEITLRSEMLALIEQKRWRIQMLSRALTHLSPQARLNNDRQRLDGQVARLERAMANRLERARGRLRLAEVGLTAVSPLATLARGYAIVWRAEGQIVRHVAEVNAGDRLSVQVSDGRFTVAVDQG
jgi:exodeoxyribonuclease VII large subunit